MGLTRQLGNVPMKSCKFIHTDKNTIFVKRPSSWLGGWARSHWLNRYFKQGTLITGNDEWEWLREQYGIKLLLEENGKYEVHILEEPLANDDPEAGITI